MTIFITSNHKMIARPALLILSLEICQICRILQRVICIASSVKEEMCLHDIWTEKQTK